MNTTSETQTYFVSGQAVELWENARQPFGWGEDDLDGYARYGRWDLLFNALVLACTLERTSSS